MRVRSVHERKYSGKPAREQRCSGVSCMVMESVAMQSSNWSARGAWRTRTSVSPWIWLKSPNARRETPGHADGVACLPSVLVCGRGQ